MFGIFKIQDLIDDAKCYETVRKLRWSDGVRCPRCFGANVIKRGFDESHPERQRYFCHHCERRFDDLTNTVFSRHHQPLKTWVLCLYFMGLNISNRQICRELSLNKDDVQKMTSILRQAIDSGKPDIILEGEVECDEVYVIAGHKGNPEAVKKKGVPLEEIVSRALGVEGRLKKRNRPFSE